MNKPTDEMIRTTIATAIEAAKKATESHIKTNGAGVMCGFAWAVVSPGTSKVARILKEFGGSKAYGIKGIQLWNPSGHHTQCIVAKEVGAGQFVKVMKDAFPELMIYASSRLD